MTSRVTIRAAVASDLDPAEALLIAADLPLDGLRSSSVPDTPLPSATVPSSASRGLRYTASTVCCDQRRSLRSGVAAAWVTH